MTLMVAAAVGVIVAGLPGGAVALIAAVGVGEVRIRRRSPVDVVEVAARLLVLVGAGMSLLAALAKAAEATGVETQVQALVRRATRMGTAAALATAEGPLAPLLRRLADAARSGATVEPAIRAFIEMERRRRHTAAIERARRLPVRLMVPMTLLVLPGFLLMVYGPALIGLVTDLVGPLAG